MTSSTYSRNTARSGTSSSPRTGSPEKAGALPLSGFMTRGTPRTRWMLWTAACMMEETSGSKWLNMGDLNPRRGLVAAEVGAGVGPGREGEEVDEGGLGLAPGPRGTEGGDVLGLETGEVGAGREVARRGPGPRSRGAAAEADQPRRSAQEVEVLRG